MTEDEIMEGLRALAKARSEHDPAAAWDRLASSELTEEERRELLVEAEDDADVLVDLFSPLGDAFEEDLARELLGGDVVSFDEASGSLPPAVQPDPAVQDVLDDAPRPANGRRPWILALVPVLAIAAALLLWVAVPGGPRQAELPDYAWTVQGGDQGMRGTPSEPSEGPRALAAGSSLTLSARPDVASEAAVGATVLVVRGGELVRTEAQVEVAPSGAVRWTGTSGTEPLVGAVEEVVLVVHATEATPAEVLRLASEGGNQVHRVPVELR